MRKLFRHLDRVSQHLAAPNTIHFLSLAQLNRSLNDVWKELHHHGFASQGVDSTAVTLISPLGVLSPQVYYNGPYGFFEANTTAGEINIPAVSWSALGDLLAGRTYVSLRDVLRHEYAHAVEHHHGDLIHCDRFEEAFGVAHDHEGGAEFDPERFVSRYAASWLGQEDYAETFMLFVKYGGNLPARFNTRTIRRKWRFIADLAKRIERERKRSSTACCL